MSDEEVAGFGPPAREHAVVDDAADDEVISFGGVVRQRPRGPGVGVRDAPRSGPFAAYVVFDTAAGLRTGPETA